MSEVKDRTLLLVQYVDTSEFLQGKKKKKWILTQKQWLILAFINKEVQRSKSLEKEKKQWVALTDFSLIDTQQKKQCEKQWEGTLH